MIAVIFELWPGPGRHGRYFELAAAMQDELQTMDGFVSVERFESVSEAGKYVSLSFWRDEAALHAWRNLPAHRDAQKLGRDKLFLDYRLRIAAVTRDYGAAARAQAPTDSNQYHGVTR